MAVIRDDYPLDKYPEFGGMKRGFQLVGRVLYPWKFVLDACVQPGDVLFVTYAEDAPFRCGSVRARDIGACHPPTLIPAIAENDLVYRATAIGEDAFDSPRPSGAAPCHGNGQEWRAGHYACCPSQQRPNDLIPHGPCTCEVAP